MAVKGEDIAEQTPIYRCTVRGQKSSRPSCRGSVRQRQLLALGPLPCSFEIGSPETGMKPCFVIIAILIGKHTSF